MSSLPIPEAWGQILQKTELFSGLDATALAHLTEALEEKPIPAGTYLVRQGDAGDSLFVVLEGTLNVLLELDEEVLLHPISPGDVVGEMALALGGARAASIRAIDDARVLELPRERFESIVRDHPAIMGPFSKVLRERIRRVSIVRHLRDLFGKLDSDILRELEREMTWLHLPSGQVLFRQGDPADGAYIVAVGRMRVVVDDGQGGERAIDEVGPGQWIGEMALLTRRGRSATVHAIRDTDLVRLSQAAFDSMTQRSPRAMIETSRLLVARLERQMDATRPVRAQTNTVAIVPTRPGLAIDEFTRHVVESLGAYGSVLHLTAEEVDKRMDKQGIARLPPSDPGHMRLAPWLMDQESAHRFVVYQADPEWSEWTDRSIRHADRILFVADGDASPTPTATEQKAFSRFEGGRAPKQYLVLLQPPGRKTHPGTAKWLAPRPIERHFHVSRGKRGDVARLVRLLIGNAVCLVLGGGGSRGFAHLGVLRAFEELGIPVDAIGGTSIGAIVGASAAMGTSADDLLTKHAPLLASILTPTVPIVSLMSGRGPVRLADTVVGTLDIEDTAIPYFCISTNLTRGGEVIHDRGSFAQALLATAAVPGVWPPVARGMDFLVDGGLSNNVPVDTMASLFGGIIVAVDVIPETDLVATPAARNSVSGEVDVPSWWRRMNPFEGRGGLPNIINTLMRTVTTASGGLGRGARANLASLYLRPRVDRWNLFDFRSAAPIAEQGYRETVKEIAAWWKEHADSVMGVPPRVGTPRKSSAVGKDDVAPP